MDYRRSGAVHGCHRGTCSLCRTRKKHRAASHIRRGARPALVHALRKFKDLVQSGPFSINRNPLYMFSLLAALGAGMQSGSLLFAIVSAVFYWIVIDSAVRREELALLDRFGSTYAAYCKRAPRYGLRISSWADVGRVEVLTSRLYRTAADGVVFFTVVPLASIYARLHAAGILPVLLPLPL